MGPWRAQHPRGRGLSVESFSRNRQLAGVRTSALHGRIHGQFHLRSGTGDGGDVPAEQWIEPELRGVGRVGVLPGQLESAAEAHAGSGSPVGIQSAVHQCGQRDRHVRIRRAVQDLFDCAAGNALSGRRGRAARNRAQHLHEFCAALRLRVRSVRQRQDRHSRRLRHFLRGGDSEPGVQPAEPAVHCGHHFERNQEPGGSLGFLRRQPVSVHVEQGEPGYS